ncbi:MAG: lysophospholipid acyltransferase family protein, partial [Halioglobus sp.]|nr:lysophospholipid acyltransferase family protein [Halioglobus sp.]
IASRLFGGAWGRGLVRAVPCRLRITGLEHIDPGTPYILVANHLSLMDIPILYGWLPLDLKWVMKTEVRRSPLIGSGTAMMGHIFVDRADHDAAIHELHVLEDNLQPGMSILVFPEGTRSRSGRLQAFKMGAFHMAVELQVPILPITIRGTNAILTPDTMDLNPGRAELIVHPPISRADVVASSPEALRDRAREIISSALHEPPPS